MWGRGSGSTELSPDFKYDHSPKGRARRMRYDHSPKRRATARRWRTTDTYREFHRFEMQGRLLTRRLRDQAI
jgi:hypothetical protein